MHLQQIILHGQYEVADSTTHKAQELYFSTGKFRQQIGRQNQRGNHQKPCASAFGIMEIQLAPGVMMWKKPSIWLLPEYKNSEHVFLNGKVISYKLQAFLWNLVFHAVPALKKKGQPEPGPRSKTLP